MPLYNVELTLKCTMVVQAEDCDDAQDVAYANWKEAIDDADARPVLHVTGDVTQERHLRDGWDGQCVPYGGDGNTRISALLTHNAKSQATDAALSRQVACTDGLGVAVPVAPILHNTGDK